MDSPNSNVYFFRINRGSKRKADVNGHSGLNVGAWYSTRPASSAMVPAARQSPASPASTLKFLAITQAWTWIAGN